MNETIDLYEKYSHQFPMLKTQMNGKRLVYLDTAATALKPQSVTDSIARYYTDITCNVHRSIHTLGEKSTIEYEQTRDLAQKFINAKKREEVIFTKGTTDGLNFIARTLGDEILKSGDEILITELEHHSNIVPWQLCAKRTGAIIKVLPINEDCDLDIEKLDTLLTEKTKIVSFTGISNTIGTINPVSKIIEKVKSLSDAKIVIDAAQMVSHEKIDVQSLNCDFLVFSAHKLFGPTGVGILYGKEDLLNSLPPLQGGGDMIDDVTFEETTYNVLPYKFEAGTPNIAAVIGFSKAIEFTNEVGLENIHRYNNSLIKYLDEKIVEVKGFQKVGKPQKKTSISSFNLEGIHNQDLASLISMDGVAIRTGHHCTQPLLKKLNLSSTARASLSIYNKREDVDIFINSLIKAQEMLA